VAVGGNVHGSGLASGAREWKAKGQELSKAARLNNEIIMAREAADSAMLCKLIKDRHGEFNSVNLVTAWRALVKMLPPARLPPTQGGQANGSTAVWGKDAWKVDKSRGSELDRSARVALKQQRYAEAAELAHRATLSFGEAGNKGLKQAARMAKDSLSLHHRCLSALFNSSSSSSSSPLVNTTRTLPPSAIAAYATPPPATNSSRTNSMQSALLFLEKGIVKNVRELDARQCVGMLYLLAKSSSAFDALQVLQMLHAVLQLLHAVLQLLHAVLQMLHAVLQLLQMLHAVPPR
jgi:hypothetical protein